MTVEGKREEAFQIASKLEEMSARRYVSSVDIAVIYCGLEDHDRTLGWLDKAYQKHGKGLDIIGIDPLFDKCRSDPRFQDLLRNLKLAP